MVHMVAFFKQNFAGSATDFALIEVAQEKKIKG